MKIKEKVLEELGYTLNESPEQAPHIEVIDKTLAEVDKLIEKYSEFVYGYYEGDKYINSLGFKKLKEEIGIDVHKVKKGSNK